MGLAPLAFSMIPATTRLSARSRSSLMPFRNRTTDAVVGLVLIFVFAMTREVYCGPLIQWFQRGAEGSIARLDRAPVRRTLPFSQHPRRHRSQILHDGRLDRVDQLGSELLRHLHQHRLVDQVPLGAVRHRVPATVQMPEDAFGPDGGPDAAEE